MRVMDPIQLWLPVVQGGTLTSEVRRDMQRLFRVRTCEHVLWTVPRWTGPRQWRDNELELLAGCISGEGYECVRVLYVGEQAAVVGPAADAFPSRSVNGLLDKWLNSASAHAVFSTGSLVRLKVPHLAGAGVELVSIDVPVSGSGVLPIKKAASGNRVRVQWPPTADAPHVVSPASESAVKVPSGTALEGTIPARLSWSPPFDALGPSVVTTDDLYQRDRMRQVAEISAESLEDARRLALVEARDWISVGQATLAGVWLNPIIAAEGGVAAAIALGNRFGVDLNDLEDVPKDKALLQKLKQPVPVRRVWGLTGLMWALLMDRLNAAEPFRTCERCGRLLSGRANKRFCSENENPECYRARKRFDKRRSRTK